MLRYVIAEYSGNAKKNRSPRSIQRYCKRIFFSFIKIKRNNEVKREGKLSSAIILNPLVQI